MQLDQLLSDGRCAHLRRSDAALTIALGPDLVYTLDLHGRLIGAFRQGQNLRRGLDGRVLARWRLGGLRQRQWLSPAEIEQLFHDLRADLARILASHPSPAIADLLRRAYDYNPEHDIELFHHIYRPISILPPDQYQALVLQATEGCSFNTCTFCALYRDRPFRIRNPEAFSQHITDVREFFGAGIRFRRSIFLADANALIIPQPQLLPLFDAIARSFILMPESISPPQRQTWLRQHPDGVTGVYAFIDGLSAERKTSDDFSALRQRGLRRVYIGLESGHEPLLTWLRKPSAAAAMRDDIIRMKQSGLHLGVIILTGIGGSRFHSGHCIDTAAILNAMPLDGDDIIYFSPFQPDPDAPYNQIAAAEGIEPTTPAFAQTQERIIRAALTLPSSPTGPKRVPYNLHDFVY